MQPIKITKRTVDTLAAQDREFYCWDSVLPGFGVRVRPSGAKSFVATYRLGGRNAPWRRVTLGAVGKIEAEAARKEAERIIAKARLGQDHAADKARKRAEMNVASLCDIYLAEGCDTKKPSTLVSDKGRIERHIKPLLGRKLVSEVSRADIEKFMRDVAAGKTAVDVKTKAHGRAIVEGGKGTATRTVGLLGGIFSFAKERSMRADNPVQGVKRYPDRKSETFLSAAEMARVGEAMGALEADGANEAAVAILRLLAFTGARKSEISTLRWSEVDLERGLLRLETSKTGQKVMPLGAPAVEVLAGVKRIEGSPYVFPATTGKSYFQGADKVWRKVRDAAGLPGLRIHDLRHSFASMGLARGDALPIIGAILGHRDVKTTSRYAHLADDPVRQAANAIAGSVRAAMEGKPAAPVVPLRRA